jgi:exosortase
MWFGFSEWTHGILVFPSILLVLILKRKELLQIPVRGSWIGVPVLLLSILLYWLGFITDLQYVGYLAIQVFIAGLVLWFLGIEFFEKIFFIWLFLLFAWPFVFLDQYVGFPLRLLMSESSARFLNMVGVPTIREGTAILSAADAVAGTQIGQRFSVDIADPCSGIHSLFALTMISSLYGICVFRKGWQILLVFFSAFPFAIFGNFCRILMLTFGTVLFGTDFAIGTEESPSWFHMGAGFLVYVAALGAVLIFGWLIGKIGRTPASQPARHEEPKTESRSIAGLPWIRSLVVVAITVLAVVLISQGQELNEERISGVMMKLPDSVPGYLGFDEAVSDAEIRILPSDTEFAKKRYIGAAPVNIDCEIVLSGATKSSIHRPQVCLVAQGWKINQETTREITLPDGRKQNVSVLHMGRANDNSSYEGFYIYWYIGKDRTTGNNLERILLTSWDRVVRRVNHRWAYVTIGGIFPPGLAASPAAKDRILNDLIDFTKAIIPKIQRETSGGKTASTER